MLIRKYTKMNVYKAAFRGRKIREYRERREKKRKKKTTTLR